MAENLDDGEFWLPPQFLSDDSDAGDGNGKRNGNLPAFFNPRNDDVSRAMFAYLSSSPLESSETESSDEEEQQQQQHMAELTRRLAHSSLGLDLDLNNHHHSFLPSPQPKGVTGSPQSTLCGCEGSPNGACHVTSQRATWDLLRAAAGEVERMRLIDAERRRFVESHAGLVVPPGNPGVAGFIGQHNHRNQHHNSLSRQQLQIAQFELLRQRQQMEKQRQMALRFRSDEFGSVGVAGGSSVVRGNEGLSASAWPPLQRQHRAKQQNHPRQQYGSGMRAVYLGNPSGKRESTGTGVFLPRRMDGPVESKKKPACSTVLVPARVAQALNLKLDDMVPPPLQQHHHHPRYSGVSTNMQNAAVAIPRGRSSYGFTQQNRNNLRMQPPVMNHEIRLPQDWSY